MKLIFWLAGGVLLIVACAAIWFTVQSPGFWIGLVALVVPLLYPVFKASEATVKRVRDDTRRRVDRGIDGKERMR